MTLVHRLPGTLAALEAGVLHGGHLWPLLDKVAPIVDDAVRAQVEAELLGWAAGRRIDTVQPRVVREGETARLVLPGEPGYEA